VSHYKQKLLDIVEDSGGIVVAMENWGALKLSASALMKIPFHLKHLPADTSAYPAPA
jgi:hypothetical protein